MKKTLPMCALIFALGAAAIVSAQETPRTAEQRVSLTQTAIALDAAGVPALEGTLRTTVLNGTPDAPVMNVRLVVKNVGSSFLTYLSGQAGFYDGAGVRCGEGAFKLDSLAPNESAETDAPGLRVTCVPATWRIVATSLVPRGIESAPASATANFVISIDGEEHPIQLGKPLVLSLGEKKKTIIVRSAP